MKSYGAHLNSRDKLSRSNRSDQNSQEADRDKAGIIVKEHELLGDIQDVQEPPSFRLMTSGPNRTFDKRIEHGKDK